MQDAQPLTCMGTQRPQGCLRRFFLCPLPLVSRGGNRYGQLGRPGLLSESEPGMVSQLALSSQLEPAGMVAGTHQAFALCSLRREGAQNREVPPDPFAPAAAVLEEVEPERAWWGGQAELSDEELSSAWGIPLPPEGNAPDAFPMVWEEAHREQIMELTRGMLPLLPRRGFERRFRNPCWHTNSSAPGSGPRKLLCLPFFLIAGVPRCGPFWPLRKPQQAEEAAYETSACPLACTEGASQSRSLPAINWQETVIDRTCQLQGGSSEPLGCLDGGVCETIRTRKSHILALHRSLPVQSGHRRPLPKADHVRHS